jgi:putative tricarboxylic transport membrane protein
VVVGIVMGTMVEQAFVTSLIKSDGSILPFFERPVSPVLAASTVAAFAWPLLVWAKRKLTPLRWSRRRNRGIARRCS